MKKILITGKNSYIGTSLEKWLVKYPDDYSIDTVDMRDESWKKDFSIYDVVFHMAGIAHVSSDSKVEGGTGELAENQIAATKRASGKESISG